MQIQIQFFGSSSIRSIDDACNFIILFAADISISQVDHLTPQIDWYLRSNYKQSTKLIN